MRREIVQRRRWISDDQFLDLLGATNLIPGPNSTELAIHLGYVRAGWPGLVLAGALFIAPAMLIVLGLAWVYVTYGSFPQVGWLLYGVKPVIIAVLAQALWGLSRTALKGPALATVALGVLMLAVLGVNELALLFGGGLATLLAHVGSTRARGRPVITSLLVAALVVCGALGRPALAGGFRPALQMAVPAAVVGVAPAPFGLSTLFLTFLKTGAVLYGSGYVLLAFLRGDFVHRLGWLTDQQLLDAITAGQLTPGPVFTTATFVGYLVGGMPGALLATLGIFLPSFVFVALSGPLVPQLRRQPWTAVVLDGVNAAALGLMVAITLELGRQALIDPATALVALVALTMLMRWNVNSAWLMLGGAAVGLAARAGL